MSLTAALRTAQASLTTTAAQTAVTSRNVAGAGDPTYSRKIANVVTSADGGARLVSIGRAADKALLYNMLEATSAASGQQALADGLAQIEQTIGDPELGQSPAGLLGAFADALQQYSVSPGDPILAQTAVNAAATLANGLNAATATVQDVRAKADADIKASVDTLNGLLDQFETANTAVINGTRNGTDVTDALDTRDHLLAQISEEVGISVATRGDNDMVIYTDSGVTLFETTARSVTFDATQVYGAATVGNAVYIDGVPVTGAAAVMPIKSGALQGLATLRDDVAVSYQSQLDEMARGLIEAFAESDQSAVPSLPDAPGLFTYPGAPAMPAPGLVQGLAGVIAVNPTVDPAQGGDPSLLRDGGISDPGNPAYLYNASGAASFADRINELLDKLSADRSFDPASGIDSTGSLAEFASGSVSWVEAARQSATNGADYQTTLVERSSEALSNATGVNLDNEMSLLLDLEKSYQASSKLLATIDDMLAAFIAEIR
jgi:flagellar hook-associated protein 1 FlgK